MAMLVASRRLSIGSRTVTTSLFRCFSTSFREERDTFGPILVPSDKSVLASLSPFPLGVYILSTRYFALLYGILFSVSAEMYL